MNENVRLFVLYVGAALTMAKIYDLTHVFQIKEYRFDRFFIFLEEAGGISALYEKSVKLPAKTIRNLLIIALSVLGLTLTLFYLMDMHFLFLLLFVFGSPVLAFLIVSVAVLITEIFAQIKRRLLVRNAKEHLKGKKVVGIGITGSYGKTTTKEYLFHILSKAFKVAKTDVNMNTDVGVAISILKNVSADTEFFIAEMGAYTKGEIASACRVIQPRFAILTAIGNQHLGLFGSMDNLLLAKKELLQAVPPTGHIYLNNAVHEKSILAREVQAPIITYSTSGKADATLVKKSKRYLFTYKKKTYEFEIPNIVPYAAENVAGCIALALDLKVPPESIRNALKTLPSVADKLTSGKGAHKALIIKDTANSSVEGFLSAITVLTQSKKPKKIAVSKGIIELGEEKERSYKKLLEVLKKNNVSLFTTDPLFKTLDVMGTVAFFSSEKVLLSDLTRQLDSNTGILLEGRFSPGFIESLSA